MSKYKLVPVEPTADMVIAGEDAWCTQLDNRLFAKDNGEAFATYPSEETHELCSRVAYRAMLAAAPAVQGEPVAWIVRHPHFCGKFTDDKEIAEHWENKEQGCTAPLFLHPHPTEQQPAPDMAGLVETLEKARDAIGSLPQDALGNVPDTQQSQGWHIRDELINDISTALAAYRNQGGDV